MSSVRVSCCQPPAAVDGGAAPHAGGAVEIEESAAAGATAVFDDKMAIEQNRFHSSEQGIIGIEIRPARLHHANVFAAAGSEKIGNRTAQKIAGGR